MARRRSAARIGVTGLGQRGVGAWCVHQHFLPRLHTPDLFIQMKGIVLVDTPLIPAQAMDWRTDRG